MLYSLSPHPQPTSFLFSLYVGSIYITAETNFSSLFTRGQIPVFSFCKKLSASGLDLWHTALCYFFSKGSWFGTLGCVSLLSICRIYHHDCMLLQFELNQAFANWVTISLAWTFLLNNISPFYVATGLPWVGWLLHAHVPQSTHLLGFILLLMVSLPSCGCFFWKF